MGIDRIKILSTCMLAAIALSGCVLWPDGGEPEAIPGYGAGAPEAEVQCSQDANMLICARARVRGQFEGYASRRHQIEQYRNAANLALFGISGAAGVNAVTKGSKAGLQTLGLAAAGLVGLDDVIKADRQHDAYGAGVEALQCVIDTDLAADARKRGLGLATEQLKSLRALGRSAEDAALAPYLALEERSPLFKTRQAASKIGGVNLSANRVELEATTSADFAVLHQSAFDSFNGALSARRSFSRKPGQLAAVTPIDTSATLLLADAYRRELQALDDVRQDFDTAIAIRIESVTKGDDVRANELMSALNLIRKAVSDNLLYKHADLSAIYDALKKAMEKAKPPQPAPGGQGGGTKTAAALLAAQPPGVRARMSNLSAKLALVQQDRKIAETELKTYDKCIEMAKKKGTG